VDIPERQAASLLEIELNKGGLFRENVDPPAQRVVITIAAPLKAGDELRARLDRGEWSPPSYVQAGTGGTAVCSVPEVLRIPRRPVFEATGFLGRAFDQFAPSIVGNYINKPSEEAFSRTTAGVTFDYRFLGGEHSRVQVWVPGAVLWGVRTADVDCNKEPSVPLCSSSARVEDRFLFVLDHASTIEAHFAPRVELITFQEDTDTPVKGYAVMQFGFIQLEGASKVAELDHFGIGARAPVGTFRDSLVQFTMGRTTLFQKHPGFHRFKVVGALVFDLFPALRDRISFWKYVGAGAMRGFVVVSIDRDPMGSGPDAIQAYTGFAFDFRRAFVR
jgi:hypothetical protein